MSWLGAGLVTESQFDGGPNRFYREELFLFWTVFKGVELQNGEIRNAQTQSQVSAQQREINSQRTEIERLKQQQETE